MKKEKPTSQPLWIVLLIITVIVLIMAFINDIHPFEDTVVDTTYIHSVFTATVTLSVLSISFLSMFMSIGDRKILGIPLMEIFHFRSSPIRFDYYTAFSMFIDVADCVALAFKCFTAVTAMLFVIVAWTFLMAENVIIVITVPEIVKHKIKSELRRIKKKDPEKYKIYVLAWINELKSSIISNNISDENEYMELLLEASNYEDYLRLIEAEVDDIFAISCKRHGFIKSLENISKLLQSDKCNITEINVADRYCEKMRHFTNTAITSLYVPQTIDAIVLNTSISINESEKVHIINSLIYAVLYNTKIDSICRNSVMQNTIKYLSYIHDNRRNGIVRSKALLALFRYEVMANTNQQAAIQVYKWIICAFSTASPIYKSQRLFASTIAQMFRGIYFYSYMETADIPKNRREEISEIAGITAETEEKYILSLSDLIRENERKILDYLICDAVESLKSDNLDSMEYMSSLGNAKTIVWSYYSKLRFAFCFFAAAHCIPSPFPLEKYFNDLTDVQKKNLCLSITDMFELPDIKPKKDLINHIYNIQTMMGRHFSLRSDLDKEYSRLNDIIQKINNSEIKNNPADFNELEASIEKYIDHEWGFIAQGHNSDSSKTEFTITYIDRKLSDAQHHAIILGDRISNKILNIISDRLPSIDIWYNQSGVQKLLDALKEHNFKYTNFKFIDDLAFDSDVRGSESFKELEKIINSIDFHDYFRDPKIFLVKDSINYSFTTAVPTPIALNSEQINYLLKSRKISDGMYFVDGATLNLRDAQEAVSQGYAFYSVNVSVSCDVLDQDGLIINTLWSKAT